MATIADINLEARALCDADTVSYPAATLLRRVNAAYERIIGKLIARNGTWQFDDSNFTTFPIGKTTLVAGQHDYKFDSTHLIIERVQVMDNDGEWHLLTPIDQQNVNIPMEEYATDDGFPTEYDKSGSSLILYPAPAAADCTLVDGLRVYYQRTASIFTTDEVNTGTKVPGFPSPYHMLLAYEAAIPYCLTYKPQRVPALMAERNRMEEELMAFESSREKDEPNRLSMGGVCSK
jgi:hypothetical protein